MLDATVCPHYPTNCQPLTAAYNLRLLCSSVPNPYPFSSKRIHLLLFLDFGLDELSQPGCPVGWDFGHGYEPEHYRVAQSEPQFAYHDTIDTTEIYNKQAKCEKLTFLTS